MQICIICKRDLRGFHGAKCPVDGYPNIDIFGDDKEYIRDHFDEIEKHADFSAASENPAD